MDALELLKKDHDKVKALFEQVEQGVAAAKGLTLFNQIYHELSIHAIIEEQVFYPSLAKYNKEFSSLLKDAYKEHAEVKRELGEIANLDSGSEEWKSKMHTLWGDIQHHVKDEEEKMFPKARETVDAKLLKELGAELKQAKSSNLDGALLSQPLNTEAGAQL